MDDFYDPDDAGPDAIYYCGNCDAELHASLAVADERQVVVNGVEYGLEWALYIICPTCGATLPLDSGVEPTAAGAAWQAAHEAEMPF